MLALILLQTNVVFCNIDHCSFMCFNFLTIFDTLKCSADVLQVVLYSINQWKRVLVISVCLIDYI